ncbi:globin [Actinomadura rupiterrae]|uniref:globin n=1 Tax=Actinomadura rupiterrae TaxID=559627 RepID=UPI0020A2D9A6|nr:globin [Actinomadura rupiterrae]MCP2341903.1 hemoglobin [Actinomadura rupiterrae]
MAEPEQVTFYEAVGGEETFRALVHRFYQGVAEDPALRAMYPEEDLGPAEERLRLFLIQYWGGPNTYSQRRGHPRLRMRHAPFVVDEAAKEAWLRHMRKALDETVAESGLPPQAEQMLWNYFTMAAQSMVNAPS